MKLNIVGSGEIADIAGVSTQAVSNWRKRHADFPEPLVVLKAGPIFDRTQVEEWLKRKNSE